MIAVLSVVAGLAILLIGGDLLVRGAVNLALRLGVPALIVSLTIVAFGTSAPELLISVDSVPAGRGEDWRWVTWLVRTSPMCCWCWASLR